MNYLNSCYHGNQNIIQSAISQKGIFNRKAYIFDANHLLLAAQNMNNFQRILYNLYLLYKYKNNSFKNYRLELPWQQLQEMPKKGFTRWPKNMTNIEICRRKNVKLKPFRLIWVFLWFHLLLFFCLEDHISCIYNFSKLCSVLSVYCSFYDNQK